MPWFGKAPKNPSDRLRWFEGEIERLVDQLRAAGQEREALLVLGERLQARFSYSGQCYRHDMGLERIMCAVVAVLDASYEPAVGKRADVLKNLADGRRCLESTL